MNIIQCAYCKSLIPEKSRFCGNCGRMLEGPGQEIEQQALASEAQFFLLLGGSASPLHGNVPVAQGTPQIDGVPFFRHGAKVQRGFRLTFRQAAISGAAIVAIIGAAVAAILLPQLVGSHAQSPLPGLFLSGNIVPGGIVSLHGSGFSSGGTVTITVDGHPVTIVSSSSLHQASYDGRSLASLPFITSRTTTVSPSATGVSVGNDGTFDLNIRIDPNWLVGSSHTLRADEQSSGQSAQFTFVVPPRPALTNCSPAATTTTLALGPVDEGQKQSVSTPFALCTTGSGLVSWVASWDHTQAAWLQLPQSGNVQAPLRQNFQVGASATGLKAGTYPATVTFNSQGSNTTVILKIMLIVRPANAPSCINTSTQSLSFTVTQGQGNPPAQTVTITNCANTDHWTTSTSTDDGARWLNAGSTGGTLNSKATQDVSISVSSANLGIGTYTGQVTFKMGSSLATVNVMLTVQHPQSVSCISAAQTSLLFVVIQGNPQSQSAKIGNCGGSGSWSASSSTTDGTSWLSVSPSHGTLAANATRDVGVQVSSNNLALGTFFGQVTFKMGSSTAIVNVVLVVQSPPASRACLSASPHFLPFTSFQRQSDPSPQTVTLANCGDKGDWSASTAHGATWLSLSQVSGSLKGGDLDNISIAVSTGNLSPGTYSENITFTIKTSTGQDSKTVSVSFTVQPPNPWIEAPEWISFTTIPGQGNPSPQMAQIHNRGPAGPWSASIVHGATWLSVSPMSGSLKEDARQDITFSVSSKGLADGRYTERVIFTITNSAGKQDQEHTDVTFIIQNACVQADPDSISFPLRTSSSRSRSAALTTTQSQHVFDSQTLPFNNAEDVTLTNCGDPGDWSSSVATDDGANWLHVNTTHGSLDSGASQLVSIGADGSKLKPGQYTGSITFTIKTRSGTQDHEVVAVTLNVPEVKPCIQADPRLFTFTATRGQGDPSAQTVTIKNCGGTGHWSASVATDDGANWLGVNPTKGILQSGETQDVNISVATGSVKASTNNGHITFTIQTSAGSAPATVDVTFTVHSACIRTDPQSISFPLRTSSSDSRSAALTTTSSQEAFDLPTLSLNNEQSVKLTNCGDPGDWSASVVMDNGTPWLQLNTMQGSLASGASQVVTVRADGSDLKPGKYTASITVTVRTSWGAQDDKVVKVTFDVPQKPGQLCRLDPQSLTFTATQGQGDPSAQKVTITNCGSPGDWSASVATNDKGNWLGINPAKGTVPGGGTQEVTVRVATGNLKAGRYTGQVTFTLGSATATVSVTFTVSPPPTTEPPTPTPTPTDTPTRMSSVLLSLLLVCLTGLFAIPNRRNRRKPRRFKDRFVT